MKELKSKRTILNLLRWGLELIAMIILYLVLHSAGSKKYIILLAVSVILFFFGRKKRWPVEAIVCVALPVIAYLLIGGFSTLLNANPQMTSIKDVMFWSVPIIVACAFYVFWGNEMPRVIDFQFVGSCVAYVYHYHHWLQWYGKAEDSFAFVFGAFAVYYAYRKRWILVPIAGVMMYFADKKIAFLAAAAAIAILILTWLFKQSKIFVMTVWSMGICSILYYIYAIHSGVLKHLCYSMKIIGNGRMTMYDRFQNMYDFSPFFFGKGLGNIKNILECWAIPTYEHLHNDLLKFYIELGFWGFFLFLISYGVTFYLAERRFGKKQMCGLLAMTVHSMILFMTDNVSVYIIYLVPIYCICFAMLVSEEKQSMGLRKLMNRDKIK